MGWIPLGCTLAARLLSEFIALLRLALIFYRMISTYIKSLPRNIRSDERIIGGGLLLIVSQELHEY